MTETYTRQQLATFARYYGREMLSRVLGQQTAYAGARRYYDTLGYPPEIAITDYAQRYARQDIAGRVVDLPATDSWRKLPVLSEDENEETPFVVAWNDLTKRHDLGVWAKLSRADRLSGIGRFGILLLGLKDGEEDLSQEVNAGSLNGPDDLLYLRPMAEGDADGERVTISTWNEDAQSPRYGLPELYEVRLKHGRKDKTKIHWSRIIHLAENKLDDDVYGTPRLERVFNRLDDLIKLVGGSAEATWLSMRQGTLLSPKEGYDLDMTDAEIEDEIENYVHDPMRFLMLRGVEASSLGPSEVVDVKGPFDVVLALIAAASGIPQRVLIGSAQGELSAAEWDVKQWAGEIAYRQENYAEPEILRPFIGRLIEFGILPQPTGEWDAQWPKLIEMTDAEMAEIANARATAIKNMSDALAQYIADEDERREIVGLPKREGMAANAIAANSHTGILVLSRCPLCGYGEAMRYEGHAGLLVCRGCGKTYDPEVE